MFIYPVTFPVCTVKLYQQLNKENKGKKDRFVYYYYRRISEPIKKAILGFNRYKYSAYIETVVGYCSLNRQTLKSSVQLGGWWSSLFRLYRYMFVMINRRWNFQLLRNWWKRWLILYRLRFSSYAFTSIKEGCVYTEGYLNIKKWKIKNNPSDDLINCLYVNGFCIGITYFKRLH